MTSPYYRPELYNEYTGAIPNIPDIVQILGKAMYSNEPEITDNKVTIFYTMNFTEQKKLGDSIINQSDNTWSFTTSPLPSGNYQFYAGRMVDNQLVYSNSSSNITVLSTPSPTSSYTPSPTSSYTPSIPSTFKLKWSTKIYIIIFCLSFVAGLVILFYLLYRFLSYLYNRRFNRLNDTEDLENVPLLPKPFTRKIFRDLQWWKKDDPNYKQFKQQVQRALTPQQKKQIQDTDVLGGFLKVKEPALVNDLTIYDANSLQDIKLPPYEFNGLRGIKVTKILPLQQAVKLYEAQTREREKRLIMRDIAKYVAFMEKFKNE
jgi:hypothetical protein